MVMETEQIPDQEHDLPTIFEEILPEKENVSSCASKDVPMDYTSIFTTDMVFTSRKELIQWTRDVGKRNGMVVVIKSSELDTHGRKPRLTFACERSGKFRPAKKPSINKCNLVEKKNKEEEEKDTGSKKCGCPFELKGKKMKSDDDWMVEVMCGFHNHSLVQFLDGHSFMGRLSEEEVNILVDLSRSLVKPRMILSNLKQKDKYNCTTMKTIYNVRHRKRVAEKAGRSQMQQLMHKLFKHNYKEWHTSNDATGCVEDLFFAHPLCLDLLRAFPEVLVMDCTYKTNRYRLPLLEIVGITSTQLSFSVAFVYLQSEKESKYVWALEKLKLLMDGCMSPRVILTDRDLALMNAIEKVFSNTRNMLCRLHISRNIMTNCKKLFESKERWTIFICSWNVLIKSKSEAEYLVELAQFERSFNGYPQALKYVKDSWLNPYKERFVAAWTDSLMHFGNTTTNRVESAHAKLKRHLGTSQSSFDASWDTVHNMLVLQHTEIKASIEKSLTTVQHRFRPEIFRELRGVVSRSALDTIVIESTRANDIGIDAIACGCVIRRTHGLPCAHEIAEYKRDERPIPISSIYPYWKKLDLLPLNDNKPKKRDCRAAVNAFVHLFDSSDEATQIYIERKLREITHPGTTFLLEPEVKASTRGRPTSKNKKKRIDTSTRRDPSAFELALEPFEKCYSQKADIVGIEKSKPLKKIPSKKITPKKAKNVRLTRGMDWQDLKLALPDAVVPYIQHVRNPESDGNCGFRAIADMMGMGEDNWMQVRKDLINELHSHTSDYRIMFGMERFDELLRTLMFFEPCPPFDRWMTMPDMGHLIASRYNVVLLHLSIAQCLTFLPLRSLSMPTVERRIITIGFINNNHFIGLLMMRGCPMPPVANNWYKFKYSCATGWETPYVDQIKHFRNMIAPETATQETVELDID